MNTRDTLAVVDDEFFYTCGRKFLHAKIESMKDLAEQAEFAGLTHVWAVAGTNVSRLAQEPFIGYEATEPDTDWNVTGIGRDGFSYLSVRRNSKRHEDHIEIGFPEWSRWPWKPVSSSPARLLQTLCYLEEILGFPVAYTPAWCALELFKRLNLQRWAWLEPMTLNLEEKGFSYADDIARELHWPPKGQALQIPPGATHLIRVDGNSAYNAAETGLNVGEGNPKWADMPGYYDGKRPGIWKVEVHSGDMASEWDGKRLPNLADRTWMTTDMVAQAQRSGCVVYVRSGWYWEKYHQTLRSFADQLWKARVEWRAKKPGPVQEAVHDSIRVFLKSLHGKLARPDNAPRFCRRDIWAMVVARSVAMRIYWIEKIYRELGIWPVRIKADEFTYAVSDPHALDSFIDAGKLGGLKLVSIEPIARKDS